MFCRLFVSFSPRQVKRRQYDFSVFVACDTRIFPRPLGVNKGLSEVRKLPEILDLNKDKLSVKAIHIFERLHEQFKLEEEQVLLYEKDIEAHVKSEPLCKEILKIEGIGPITALAFV